MNVSDNLAVNLLYKHIPLDPSYRDIITEAHDSAEPYLAKKKY